MNSWTPVLAATFFFAFLAHGSGREIRLKPADDWFGLLHGGKLQPGDEVILHAGTYSDRRLFEMKHRGTPAKPIVIRAAKGERVVFKRPDARQNSINLAGTQYLELRGFEITGGSTGIRIRKEGGHMAKFVTLEGLHIHHTGGEGVTANNEGNTYEGLRFRKNHIHHTAGHGEAFYLGCNNARDGSTPGYLFNSVIEQNYIHHLNGPKVSQGDGIEIKDGSYGNIIRDNVIHDTKFPGITVYGTDGKAPNVIARNAIWNTGDNGIQAAADAVVRNNLVRHAGGSGIYSRAHQSAKPGRLMIVHNTVISNNGRPAIRVIPLEDGTLDGPVLIANNALFNLKGGSPLQLPRVPQLTLAGNAGLGGADAGKDLLGDSFFPAVGSSLVGKAALKYLVKYDFNGTPRAGSRDAGAYRFLATGNPGWKVQAGFKKLPWDE